MHVSNVLNFFKPATLLNNNNVLKIGGNTDFTKDAIITVEGDPALGESNFAARWAEFVASSANNITNKFGDHTLLPEDNIVIFDIPIAAIATLPDPTGNEQKAYSVLNKYTSVGHLTFSRTINGDGLFALKPNEVINIISDGTEYLMHQ